MKKTTFKQKIAALLAVVIFCLLHILLLEIILLYRSFLSGKTISTAIVSEIFSIIFACPALFFFAGFILPSGTDNESPAFRTSVEEKPSHDVSPQEFSTPFTSEILPSSSEAAAKEDYLHTQGNSIRLSKIRADHINEAVLTRIDDGHVEVIMSRIEANGIKTKEVQIYNADLDTVRREIEKKL